MTGGLTGLFKLASKICTTYTGIAIGTNFVINGMKYNSGEIDLYSMLARDGMTLIEFGISKIPYGIGVVPSIALTAYDIGGGFEQTFYDQAWTREFFRPNYDIHKTPIYYRHGK